MHIPPAAAAEAANQPAATNRPYAIWMIWSAAECRNTANQRPVISISFNRPLHSTP